jgi:murein DD-endopeptidase MepM/ murein hydrolase activator NlpD
MVAIFGSLIGLATVASLIALGMNLDAEQKQPTASAGNKAAPTTSSTTVKRPAYAVKKRVSQKLPGPWRITDEKGDSTTRTVEGKVGSKAFLVAVADAGIKQKEAYRLLIAYKGLRDLDNCDRSDRFRALVERGSGRLKAFEYLVSAEEVYQAREDKDGYLKAKQLDLKVARRQVKGAFLYDGESIKQSSASSGFEKGLRKVVSKALEGHSSVDELTRGDRLRVVAQEVTVLGEFSRYAGIEALELLPKNEKEKPLRIYYFHHARAGGYYNARGQAPYEGGWRKPIKDASVTSKFNPKRMHPVLKKVMPHNGTDFGAPAGTPVGASSYGTISFIGQAGPSGNLVKIDHPGGIETGYAHLSRFATGLKLGDKVKRLQLVGYVGSTGRSTGPHLHFSAKKDGKFIDAESLNLDGMRVLNAEFRGEFEVAKASYDKLLNVIPLPPPFKPPKEAVVAKLTKKPATPDPGAAEPDEDAEDEGQVGSASDTATEEAEVAEAPAAPRKPATPAAKAASAVYLTDKELLEMQTVTDDGEVAE